MLENYEDASFTSLLLLEFMTTQPTLWGSFLLHAAQMRALLVVCFHHLSLFWMLSSVPRALTTISIWWLTPVLFRTMVSLSIWMKGFHLDKLNWMFPQILVIDSKSFTFTVSCHACHTVLNCTHWSRDLILFSSLASLNNEKNKTSMLNACECFIFFHLVNLKDPLLKLMLDE